MNENDVAFDVNENCSSSATWNMWSEPEIIEILELMDSVEIIYKETSNVMYTIYPPPPPEQRVYKIVYSCVDGKWNKSEPIPGEIIRATEETYDF